MVLVFHKFIFQNIANFMKDVYKNRYGLDLHEDTVNRLYSIAVSIFAIGGMLGGFSGGMIANRFGRYSFCQIVHESY